MTATTSKPVTLKSECTVAAAALHLCRDDRPDDFASVFEEIVALGIEAFDDVQCRTIYTSTKKRVRESGRYSATWNDLASECGMTATELELFCFDHCSHFSFAAPEIVKLRDRRKLREAALNTQDANTALSKGDLSTARVCIETAARMTATGDESADLQAHFFRIGQERGLKEPERWKKMAVAVLDTLNRRGKFYFHADYRDFSTAMYFDARRKLLLLLDSDTFNAWLSEFVGINRTLPAYRFIFAAIQDAALTGPTTTAIVPELFWAARRGAIYLSNGDGHLVKITAQGVSLADNGTDEILFPAGRTLAPWKLSEIKNPFESCALFRELCSNAPHAKILFLLWVCSLPTGQRTKPPLVLTGPVGSGKTRLAVGICELLGLLPRVLKIEERSEGDLWTSLDAGGLVCLDNADTRIDWLPDALAAAATDGNKEKRRLYKDRETILLRARAWAVVTSANPTFAADAGLADRLLPIRLERRTTETAESALSDEIAANRDAGLSWLCEVLANALADIGPTLSGLNRRHPDFSTFAQKIGRAIGCEAEAIAALKSAEADKSRFNLENDDIGAALLDFMHGRGEWRGTADELHKALGESDAFILEHSNARKIGKRLVKLWPHLQAMFSARQDKDRDKLTRYTLAGNAGCGVCGVSRALFT